MHARMYHGTCFPSFIFSSTPESKPPHMQIVARALAPQGYTAYGIWGSGWCWMCTKELAGWGGAAKSRLSLEPESNRWPFDDPCIHYSRTLCQLSYRRRSVWTPQVAVWHAAVYKPKQRARRQARHEISKSPWPPWKTRSQRHARPAAAALRYYNIEFRL